MWIVLGFLAKERDEVFNSIKLGRVAHGMPAFSEGLSDEMIGQLTDYILSLDVMVPLVDESHITTNGLEISEVQKFKVDTVVEGLVVPWGLEFLPNGDYIDFSLRECRRLISFYN